MKLDPRVSRLEALQAISSGGGSGPPGGSALRTASLLFPAIAATQGPTTMSAMPVQIPGSINSATYVMGSKPFGAGESVTIDVRKKGGASILSAPFTINSATTAASATSFLTQIATVALAIGDELQASATYVQGGTPNNPDFTLNITWA